MSLRKKVLSIVGASSLEMLFLAGLYLGIVSLAMNPQHAVEQFWQDRRFTLPIILGFGIQAGLYITLRKRLYVTLSPALPNGTGPTGAVAGASGTTSTLAMIACCAHHVTDVLPVLGLTTAAAFLGRYPAQPMLVGLVMTYVEVKDE